MGFWKSLGKTFNDKIKHSHDVPTKDSTIISSTSSSIDVLIHKNLLILRDKSHLKFLNVLYTAHHSLNFTLTSKSDLQVYKVCNIP